jgi:hypothetical protein
LINFAVQLDAALAVPTPLPLIAPLLTPHERAARTVAAPPPSSSSLLNNDDNNNNHNTTTNTLSTTSPAQSHSTATPLENNSGKRVY